MKIYSCVPWALTVTSRHKPIQLKTLQIVQYNPELLPRTHLGAPFKLQSSEAQELHTSEPQCCFYKSGKSSPLSNLLDITGHNLGGPFKLQRSDAQFDL